MARKTKAEKLTGIHGDALIRFDKCFSACEDQRNESLQDRRFYSIAGAQWEGVFGEQFANRPRLEVNKTQKAVMRVINEWRNNRITVNFISKDGTPDEDLADLCNGLFRADEADSVAEEAYDAAFEEGVGGGMGAWRLCAEYEDDEDEDDDRQRIRLEPIFDADSTVFFDPNAKRFDKSDAKFCFVLTSMSREAFEDEYDGDAASWEKPITDIEFDWSTPDNIYVAEYYVLESESYYSYRYRRIDGTMEKYTSLQFEDNPDLEQTLDDIGTIRVGEKRVKRNRVHKYIMSGGRILEDCGRIAGAHIPVIPFYGKRWFIDGIERFSGVVRYAKDAQRLKNMQLSGLAETAAYGGIEKPIFTPEQVAGVEEYWMADAVERYAYMLVNPITDANGQEIPNGPIGYTKTPTVPQAMAALLQISEDDISDILGSQEAGEEIDGNLSGKAVELVQNRLDLQSFIYMSNMAKSVRRCGEVWLGMARDLYVEEARKMKTIGEDGEIESATVNEGRKFDNGDIVLANDLSRAKFDVSVDVGPSSSSRRSATVRVLTSMMQMVSDPTDKKVLSAMALVNIEGEGIKDVREYYRRQLVQLGVKEPTDADIQKASQAAQNAQPDPQAGYLMAEAQKAAAQARKADADTVGALADAEYAKARTAETVANIPNSQRESVAKAVAELSKTATAPPSNGVR